MSLVPHLDALSFFAGFGWGAFFGAATALFAVIWISLDEQERPRKK